MQYSHNGKQQQEHGIVIIATGGFGADFSDDSLLSKVEQEWRCVPAKRCQSLFFKTHTHTFLLSN